MNADQNIVAKLLEHGNIATTLEIYGNNPMNIEEKKLLKSYLTHLNILGKDGTHPHIEAWYQEVRYAQGPNAPHSVMEASELRYKDVLEVWPKSHWPDFALRPADVFQSYTAW